jgi:hypothetical protein
MSGLDELGTDDPNYVGFDYTSLLKGMGGLVSGVAEGFGDKKGGGDGGAEKARLEEQKRQAEKSASTMKYVLIGVVGFVGVVGLVLLSKSTGPSK